MTRKLSLLLSVFAGFHFIAFLIVFFIFFNKWVLLGLFVSFSFGVFYAFRMKYENSISPLELATMFVEGLRKEKFGPPISQVEDSGARPLMEALNNLARDIENKNSTIAKLEKMRMEFVANVSHELKTPLSAIRGYTETLLNGAYKETATAETFLKRIELNSERLSFLISDLLELSRLESTPTELHWVNFPVAHIQERLEAIFFPVLNQTGHKLLLQFQDSVWEGDRKKLEQVFFNLIDNAIKHTPQGTKIEFKQSQSKSDMIYVVKDDGPGIEAHHLPRLFERFYRVDAARSRETGGTGLGLSIAKHVVLAHGGSISVESTPGGGTTFTVRLPRRSESFEAKNFL